MIDNVLSSFLPCHSGQEIVPYAITKSTIDNYQSYNDISEWYVEWMFKPIVKQDKRIWNVNLAISHLPQTYRFVLSGCSRWTKVRDIWVENEFLDGITYNNSLAPFVLVGPSIWGTCLILSSQANEKHQVIARHHFIMYTSWFDDDHVNVLKYIIHNTNWIHTWY